MNIENQHQPGGGYGGQAVRFFLDEGEQLHILHPAQVIAYRGATANRVDRLMNIKGMYRKRKLVRADFTGPCELAASLPPGISLKAISLSGGSDLLYDFRHLFFYTDHINMESRILSIKNMMITRDAVKMKFSGEGEIGILTQGQVLELELHPVEPLYVEAGCVVAYPESARMELAVYGNHLASQHMRYQWKITGQGSVLVQATGGSRLQQELESGDGIVKRFLREAIPFGGVIIK